MVEADDAGPGPAERLAPHVVDDDLGARAGERGELAPSGVRLGRRHRSAEQPGEPAGHARPRRRRPVRRRTAKVRGALTGDPVPTVEELT